MSVKILPFLDQQVTFSSKTTEKTAENSVSFQEVLTAEKRASKAMAVDALIARSGSGGVSGKTIQEALGFLPQAVSGVTDSANVQEAAVFSVSPDSPSSSLGCPQELEAYFKEAAETYQVDIRLLEAVAKAESGFNPSARSSAGAMGVMQLMPATASSLGIKDAYNARDNILGGAKILSQNLSRYNGDLSLALAGYNAGCGNVDKYGGIPPFTETQNYVKKVLGYYNSSQE